VKEVKCDESGGRGGRGGGWLPLRTAPSRNNQAKVGRESGERDESEERGEEMKTKQDPRK